MNNNAIDSLQMRLFPIFISISFFSSFFSFLNFSPWETSRKFWWASKLANLDHPVLKLDASVVRQRRKCLRYHAVLWPTLWVLSCGPIISSLSFIICCFYHVPQSSSIYWTKSRSKPEGPRPGVLSSVFTVLDNGFSHFVNLLFIQFARHVGDPATDVSTHSWKRPQKRPAGRWNCWWYLGCHGEYFLCSLTSDFQFIQWEQ